MTLSEPLSHYFLHSMDPKSQNNCVMMPCFHIPSCDGSVFKSRRPGPVRSSAFVCSRLLAFQPRLILSNKSPVFQRILMLFIQLQLHDPFIRHNICELLLFDYHIQICDTSHQQEIAFTTHFYHVLPCCCFLNKFHGRDKVFLEIQL